MYSSIEALSVILYDIGYRGCRAYNENGPNSMGLVPSPTSLYKYLFMDILGAL